MLAWTFRKSSIAVAVVLLLGCGGDDKKAAFAGTGGASGEAGDGAGGSAGTGDTGGSSGSGGRSGTGGTGGRSGTGGTGGEDDAGTGGDGDAEVPQGGGPAPGEPRDGVNVFFSGHSGFGLIMPAMVDQIATALGREHNYNLQMGIGSSLRLRLSGTGNEQDRDGRPLSFEVTDEIPNATTLDGAKYDALVVTEALMLINNLQYGDSVNQLRGFYDLLMQSDPNGRVFLYDQWETAEGGDFAAWASSTREMFVLWECLASAVNKDVDNKIQMVPGGMALIRAAEEAAAGNIPGVAPEDLFVADLLHPSLGLGSYYLALVMYATLYNRDPTGAPTSFTSPQGMQAGFVSAEGAEALQALAWRTVRDFHAEANAERPMAECRSAINAYCDTQDCTNRINQSFAD